MRTTWHSDCLELKQAVAKTFGRAQGVDVDAQEEVVVCCGQTEAFAMAVLAMVEPGEEVVLFEPVYETYSATVRLAGGTPVYVQLHPPDWTFRVEDLEAVVNKNTKAVVINSPHNPTGKVFTRAELETVARICSHHFCYVISDEVYESFVYTEDKHISFMSLPNMKDRCIVTSSASKTFHATGWRIGWAIACKEIIQAMSSLHVKFTDSAPAPFQMAVASALNFEHEYMAKLQEMYAEKRRAVCQQLVKAGYDLPHWPSGSFYVFARIPEWTGNATDVQYAEHLLQNKGVAVVPGSVFWESGSASCEEYKHKYVRIAYCKKDSTLDAVLPLL